MWFGSNSRSSSRINRFVRISTLRVDRVYAYISFGFFGFALPVPTRRKRAKTNMNKREDYCAHTNTHTNKHSRHTRTLKAIYFSNQFFLASFCLCVCVFCLISYDFNRSANHHRPCVCVCVCVEKSHEWPQSQHTNTGESHRANTLTLTSLTWSHASALHGDTYYVATLCRMKTTKRYTRSTHHRWRDDDKDKKK